MLLVRGARVNATNMGDDTSLHLAASHGHRQVVLVSHSYSLLYYWYYPHSRDCWTGKRTSTSPMNMGWVRCITPAFGGTSKLPKTWSEPVHLWIFVISVTWHHSTFASLKSDRPFMKLPLKVSRMLVRRFRSATRRFETQRPEHETPHCPDTLVLTFNRWNCLNPLLSHTLAHFIVANGKATRLWQECWMWPKWRRGSLVISRQSSQHWGRLFCLLHRLWQPV